MARLKKCPICKEERQQLYSRQGKVYTKEGNKAMKATDYRICHACDTVFDKDDKTHYQAITSIKNALTAKINQYFNNLKVVMIDSENIDDKEITTLTTTHKEMEALIADTFSHLQN